MTTYHGCPKKADMTEDCEHCPYSDCKADAVNIGKNMKALKEYRKANHLCIECGKPLGKHDHRICHRCEVDLRIREIYHYQQYDSLAKEKRAKEREKKCQCTL